MEQKQPITTIDGIHLAMTALIPVETALFHILEKFPNQHTEIVSLQDALNRALAEDVTAPFNIPPFNNSSMDGFAVRAEDTRAATQNTPVLLKVVMDIPAGKTPTASINVGEAARIMTGAYFPKGADAVIPVEQTNANWNPRNHPEDLPPEVVIFASIKPGDNVRLAGEDISAGKPILTSGTRLRAYEIGVLAAMGHSQIAVFRRPRVAIISTGDELLEPGAPLETGKIYDSNGYMLSALVEEAGGLSYRFPVAPDKVDAVRNTFIAAIDQKPDLILSSAGVSVGAFDVVRTVIDELGTIEMWKISLRPGKPLTIGQLKGLPFIGLPGNPVSTAVTFELFVRPALLKIGGQLTARQEINVILGEDLKSDGRRSYLRVQLSQEANQWIARTTGTQSSGALTSMIRADALLIVPEAVTFMPTGHHAVAYLLRPLHEIK
jgi:molybdopterin molybdotransferase